MPTPLAPLRAESARTRELGLPPLPLLGALITPEDKFAFASGQALVVTSGNALKRWVFWQTKKLWQFDLIPHANEALEGLVTFMPPDGTGLQVTALYARSSLAKTIQEGLEGSFKSGERYAALAEEQLEQYLRVRPAPPGAPFITER